MNLSVQTNSTILVLNSSYEPLHFTDWKRAVVLLFKDKAKLINKRIIRLVKYVRIPFSSGFRAHPKRKMIYKRDHYTCQYCGSIKDLTIDHVIPKSKGGTNNWDNLVTCCRKCNLKKGNKFLSETNMILRSEPKVPFNNVHLDLNSSGVTEWSDYSFF